MNKPTVEFVTTVYEKDWELILKSKRLEEMITGLNYDFHKKTLLINNVKNLEKVKKYAQSHIDSGLLSSYIIVEDYKEKVKAHFNIENDKGEHFLIQHLVIIYLSEADYLIGCTGDSMIMNDEEWIETAIKKIESDKKVVSASPSWYGNIDFQMRESSGDDEDFYYSFVFSDQLFLIPPPFFKKDMYNEKNEVSKFYPKEVQGAFEERVYKYLRNHGYQHIKHKRALYRHKNLPKSRLKTWLCLNLGINRIKYGISV